MNWFIFVLSWRHPKSKLFIPNPDKYMARSSTNSEFISSSIPNSVDVCLEFFDLAELG